MKFFNLSSHYQDFNSEKIKKRFPQLDQNIQNLENIQNYHYQNKNIAACALLHRSALVYWPKNKNVHDVIFSNEKLEYLGDSFLSFFVTSYSMFLFPHLSEGELSKLRAIVVGEKHLAQKSRSFHLGDYLLFGKTEKKIIYRNHNSILADAFEAITAALLIDAGQVKALEWLKHVFHTDILEASKHLTDADAKGALQHLAQSKFGSIPIYQYLDVSQNKNSPLFEARVSINHKEVARETAVNKKEASKKVAQAALSILEKQQS